MTDKYSGDGLDAIKDVRDQTRKFSELASGNWQEALKIDQEIKARTQLRELSEASKKQVALQEQQLANERERHRAEERRRAEEERERRRIAALPKCPDYQNPLDGDQPRRCAACRTELLWLNAATPLTHGDAESIVESPESSGLYAAVIDRISLARKELGRVTSDHRNLVAVSPGDDLASYAKWLIAITHFLHLACETEVAHQAQSVLSAYHALRRANEDLEKAKTQRTVHYIGFFTVTTVAGLIWLVRVFDYQSIGIWQTRAILEAAFVGWGLSKWYEYLKSNWADKTSSLDRTRLTAHEECSSAHKLCLALAADGGEQDFVSVTESVAEAVSLAEEVIDEADSFVRAWERIQAIVNKENPRGLDAIRSGQESLRQLLASRLSKPQGVFPSPANSPEGHAKQLVASVYRKDSRIRPEDFVGDGCQLALLHVVTETSAKAVDTGRIVAKPLVTNSIGMTFVPIPPGEFMMGSPDGEVGRIVDEEVSHCVRITNGFLLGQHQVTQSQYFKVMSENPSFFLGPRRPVEHVTWQDANRFCALLSEIPEEKEAGRAYRLPSEAEWEYACRAGTTTRFSSGDSLSVGAARFAVANRPFAKPTVAVGTFASNARGLHEMHGNVWEWTNDWFDAAYYSKSPLCDPQGPTDGLTHVLRGGSASVLDHECRSAMRGEVKGDAPMVLGEDADHADTQRFAFYGDFGFRVVCICPSIAIEGPKTSGTLVGASCDKHKTVDETVSSRASSEVTTPITPVRVEDDSTVDSSKAEPLSNNGGPATTNPKHSCDLQVYIDALCAIAACDGRISRQELAGMCSMVRDVFPAVSDNDLNKCIAASCEAIKEKGLKAFVALVADSLIAIGNSGVTSEILRMQDRVAHADGPPSDRHQRALAWFRTRVGIARDS